MQANNQCRTSLSKLSEFNLLFILKQQFLKKRVVPKRREGEEGMNPKSAFFFVSTSISNH